MVKYSQTTLGAVGIVSHKGKFLIAQRRADSKVAPLQWEFPGGKIENLEHPEACVVREIKEELNIKVTVREFLKVVSYVYTLKRGKHHVVLLVYIADYVSGKIKHNACNDAKWVSLHDLKKYDFMDADIPMVNELIKKYST